MLKKLIPLVTYLLLLAAMLYSEFEAFSPLFAGDSKYLLYIVMLVLFTPTTILAFKIAAWITEPSNAAAS